MRMYDPRAGRFLSLDPLAKKFAYYSPYQFAGNTPIQAIDLEGAEEYHIRISIDKQGKTQITNVAPPKVYNTFLFWSYKIPERYIVEYDNETYNIGFAGPKGNGNENFVEIFKAWKSKTNPNPKALQYLFYNERESISGQVNLGVEAVRNYLGTLFTTGYVYNPTTEENRMLGQNGTPINSKTIKQWGSTERIDVENADPGGRPGQLQYHDEGNNKYLYNVNTDKFYSQGDEGLWNKEAPKSVNNLLKDKQFRKALDKGLKYLNESPSTPGGIPPPSSSSSGSERSSSPPKIQ